MGTKNYKGSMMQIIYERINKAEKVLVKLITRKGEGRHKLIKLEMKKGNMEPALKSRESLGNILKTYSNKSKNLEEMDKFLYIYDYQS
jgi:hypothetical protein